MCCNSGMFKAIFMFAFLAMPLFLQAEKNEIFSNVVIKEGFRSAPSLSSSAVSGGVTGYLRNKWCVFNIEYHPKFNKASKDAWVDGIVLEMRAIFVGSKAGKPVNYIMTGKTTFYTVKLDGKKHTAMMAIAPHLLDRYLPDKIVARRGTLTVEAVFKSSSGLVLGRGFLTGHAATKESSAEKVFDNLKNYKPQIVLDGAILPKNKTPWEHYKVDEYDLLK